jgi:tRNA (guanine37-N1)-methyltransferase
MPHVPTSRDSPAWQATVLTLFPEAFPGPLSLSLTGQALAAGIWVCEAVDIRAFGIGRHRQVDDTPAGGGPGMVLRADVLAAAIDAARTGNPQAPALYLSPRGEPLRQPLVRELAAGPGVLLVAGRFEGVDERVLDGRGLREVSLGDYVLAGGELAAMVLIEACVRLLPGVIGAAQSLARESFEDEVLEYPHYTRPRDWEGRHIPEVLLSGDHARIEEWRRAEALRLTRARRPDLLARRTDRR